MKTSTKTGLWFLFVSFVGISIVGSQLREPEEEDTRGKERLTLGSKWTWQPSAPDRIGARSVKGYHRIASATAVFRGEDGSEAAFEARGTAQRLEPARITLALEAGRPRADITYEFDWREEHTLVRALFPTSVRSRTATFETQAGHIERPTHRSSPIEAARFEVPMQRWMDLSEPGLGVAVLNDCKFGGSAHDHTLGVSLLRSPTHPDPTADRGSHTCTLSVMVHEGDWRTAGVIAEAALLKTLGVTRRGVALLFAVEYGLLGLVAGLVGGLGALALAWAFLRYGLELDGAPSLLAVPLAALGTALLAVVAGLSASARALRSRPIEALRG